MTVKVPIRALFVALLIGLVSRPGLSPTKVSGQDERPVVDPVFVSDATVRCARLSVSDLSTLQSVSQGEEIFTPGRLDVNLGSRIALACQSHMLYASPSWPDRPSAATTDPILYALWWNADQTKWDSGYYFSRKYGIATGGDVAILRDGTTFLLPTVLYRNNTSGAVTILPNNPPYYVRKFPMPPHPSRPTQLLDPLGSFQTDGVAAQILLNREGTLAHILTDAATLYTIHTDSMTEAAPPIALPPAIGRYPTNHKTAIAFLWADLTADEHFLVTNQGNTGAITVVDLLARSARTMGLDPQPTVTGGVAINKGRVNSGMLAVHENSQFAVYDFDPTSPGPLRAVSTYPVAPRLDMGGDIFFALAWGGIGDKLIATSQATGGFNVYGLDAQRQLHKMGDIGNCGVNANDIWTANGNLEPSPTPSAPPTALPTPTITAAPSATPTATPTPLPSPTATATPTAAATSTATPTPAPIYLPLSLRERCTPEREPVDVVLAVDTSSSMEERTASGVRKLDAATSAARTFVGMLQLTAGDRAAIVAFNADARLEQPLTADLAALNGALAQLTTAPQTCLPCAVDVGATELAAHGRADAMAVLIVLTDGRSNPRPASEAVDRAAVAKAAGVTVFAIGLGTDVDAAALEAMASYPAAYLAVADASALEAAYATVARTLPCAPGAFWGRR